MQEQQQSPNISQKEQGSSIQQIKPQNYGQKAVQCPNCNAALPEGAVFCTECGLPIEQHLCPKCGSPASPIADICQDCGTWLLDGKCKFCYADIPSDTALFCPECGKPKDGIPCPNCGNLSIFDFCSVCGKPVTEEAIADLEIAKNEIQPAEPQTVNKTFSSNQEARRYFNAQRFSAAEQIAEIEAEIAQLESLANNEPESEETEEPEEEPQTGKKKSLFTAGQLASIRKTAAVVDASIKERERIAEEERKKAEEARRRAEEERKRAEEARKKAEEERKRKEELERKLRNRGWRCVFSGAVHPGGPNECACPSMGGSWVM